MSRIFITQGDAATVAFFNVKIPLADSKQYTQYKLSETDRLIFTIGRKNRRPQITKRYPQDFLDESKNNFIIRLTPKETARLPCLLHEAILTIDIDGQGKEVYTLVNQELEVVAK